MLRQVDLKYINSFNKDTMMETLDIKCVEIGKDYIVATMPVNANTHQPMKLLHGGASAALIESIGSMGSTLMLDVEKEVPVGIEINANHVGGMSSGMVTAVGKVVHAGKRTHVWQVDLTDSKTGRLVCTGRLTVMVVPRQQ
ncbi:hotdog fold thioesterase [Brumimicrobium mesophilum]|uniref:hotdog fold thioesterase n=1 Tax=Brumimicrobium mesophilum TaxID=392717 RepID=UPI000D141D68|nr:PaaI family thioesterase [Brumimicrobium mesophilum]